jgi:hypothetical protein
MGSHASFFIACAFLSISLGTGTEEEFPERKMVGATGFEPVT